MPDISLQSEAVKAGPGPASPSPSLEDGGQLAVLTSPRTTHFILTLMRDKQINREEGHLTLHCDCGITNKIIN